MAEREQTLVLHCESRHDKIRQAHNFILRGYTKGQVAKLFGVTPETVRIWLSEHKDLIRETKAIINGDDYIAEIRLEFEQLKREAWANYSNAQKEIDRSRYLNMIKSIVVDEAKVLQTMGALHREPTKTESTVDISIQLSEEEIEAMTTLYLSQQVGASPEKMIEMRGSQPKFLDVGMLEEMKPKALPEKRPLQTPYQEVLDYEES